MGPGSTLPPGSAGVRRRRRHRFRPRRVLVISALICIPVVLAIPVARYFGWLSEGAAEISEKSTKSFDLVLSEAGLRGEGADRRVTGVVVNRSGKRYKDVEISFILRDRSLKDIGTAVATIGRLEGKGKAQFLTLPVAADTFRATLREINGTAY